MNEISTWLQGHLVERDHARYLATLVQLLIGLVAVWYVTRQLLARGNAAAALAV